MAIQHLNLYSRTRDGIAVMFKMKSGYLCWV